MCYYVYQVSVIILYDVNTQSRTKVVLTLSREVYDPVIFLREGRRESIQNKYCDNCAYQTPKKNSNDFV